MGDNHFKPFVNENQREKSPEITDTDDIIGNVLDDFDASY